MDSSTTRICTDAERQVVKFAFEVGNRIQSEALRDEQGKMLTLWLADKVLDALEGEDELKLTLQR